MAYRVDYPQGKKYRSRGGSRGRLAVLTALFLLVFLMAAQLFYPQGAAILRDVLIPGDPDLTVTALEAFAQELRQGEPVGEAFEHFCGFFLEAGKLAPG